MRLALLLTIFLPALFAGTSLPASTSPRVHRGPTLPRVSRERVVQAKPKSANGISPERVSEIQNALIRTGYLKEASGTWDAGTQAAMEKLQSDNGWQVKLIPDSRALIRLGLGPGISPDLSGSAPVRSEQ